MPFPAELTEQKVAVVDDHPVVRDGLCALIGGEPGFTVVDRAGSFRDCMSLIETSTARLWVLDVCLPDGSGIDLCREIGAKRPDDRCLILTSEDDDTTARDAILAGAAGFLLKRATSRSVCTALRVLAAGGSALDPAMVKSVFDSMRYAADVDRIVLSEQEKLVLAHLAVGRSNREIAAAMFLSEKTIRNYVSRLLKKLDMDNRTQAALYGSNLEGLPNV